MRAHLLWAKRAVDANAQQVDIRYRVPVRLDRLPGECTAAFVGDGERQHHRQPSTKRVEQRLEREQCRPRVERVEDRLDHQHIRPALDQALGLLDIRLDQLIVRHGAESRIVDVRRNGGGAVRRTKRASDETLPAGSRRHNVIGGGAGELCVGQVQLVGERFHPVISQGDTGRVEGVRLNDVRPGLKVGLVDGADHLRLGDAQQVVVPLQVAIPVGKALTPEIALLQPMLLDHRAHRAIENHNALGQEIAQGLMPVAGRFTPHKVAGYRPVSRESTDISTYLDMLICYNLFRKTKLLKLYLN